jgi:16S rRNA (guanine966-N2)-methyltransferase
MLKIVAGQYRSRIIETPSSLQVPTKSIVRTGMANALADLLPKAAVLDLFAGSGALGIEALSRGAASCLFVDSASDAVSTIRANLASLKESHGEVWGADYASALAELTRQKRLFDIVFLDPPYAMKEAYKAAEKALLDGGLLTPGAAVVFEYEGTLDVLTEQFRFSRTYNYGRTHVLILRR